MELQLIDGNNIELSEDCEFELPGYMVRLAPEDVSKDAEVQKIIIAAGSDPEDGKNTLITLAGKVMILDARKFYIPDGPAVPADGGTTLFLENIEGRWPGDTPGFFVDSQWAIERSTSALAGATIKINYRNENNDT